MDERDQKIVSVVSDYLWDEMSAMRERGCTDVEGDLRVKDRVLRGKARRTIPKPAEFITLSFKVE